MLRQKENIPPDEDLFRSVSAIDVDGAAVLQTAVEMPACSFNRSKYSEPKDAMSESRPTETGVAAVRPKDLPGRVQAPGGQWYEFTAEDDPIEQSEAHSEVRLKKSGEDYNPKLKLNRTLKHQAEDALARSMRVMINPVSMEVP